MSIKQCSFSMDAVIFKVSLIVDSILIYQFSISILQIILHHAFVMTAIIVILDDKDTSILLGRDEFILAEMVFGGNDVLIEVATVSLSVHEGSLNQSILFFLRLFDL